MLGANSYPSGHTGFALAATVGGMFLLTALGHRRGWWVALGAAWTLFVGFFRMLVGVHYPTDCIGGALLDGGMALVLWPVFAGLLYVVPKHAHWLRDTRSPRVAPDPQQAREAIEG